MSPREGGRVGIKEVDGRFLLFKNGKPFFIKGGSGYTHMKELAAAGGNTIRTWDTTNLGSILDEAEKNHLSVIAGFYIPDSYLVKEFYNDSSKTSLMIRSYLSVVNKYKNHPALLVWCVGNELSFSLDQKQSAFYETMETLLKGIRKADVDHPITTTILERKNIASIKLKLPYFDFISINTFSGIKQLTKHLSEISLFWNGPYLITEWSPIGGWEAETTAWQSPIENTSTKTAEQVFQYYEDYMPLNDKRFLGSLIFYWGSKEEYTHTWFSIFGDDDKPTEVLEAIRDSWKGRQSTRLSPQIDYVLVDNEGARDNILLAPGSEHIARLVPKQGADTSAFQFNWQLLKENWWSYLKQNPQKPEAEAGLFLDSSKSVIKFKAPANEGPYRLYVTVSANNGYIANANIPFYVVGNP